MAKIQKHPEIPKTKELILKIAAERGMDEKTFINEVKRNKIVGPFNPANWARYIQIINIWQFFLGQKEPPPPPCPVCGGEQFRDPHLRGLFKSPTGLRCKTDRHHFFIVLYARLMESLGKKTYEEALKWRIEHDPILFPVETIGVNNG